MKPVISLMLAGSLAFTPLTARAADGGNAGLLKQAKISMPQARKLALAAWQGQIIKEELEQESRGSELRYSFDITRGKVTHEVGIDAKSGKVLENSIEGTDND